MAPDSASDWIGVGVEATAALATIATVIVAIFVAVRADRRADAAEKRADKAEQKLLKAELDRRRMQAVELRMELRKLRGDLPTHEQWLSVADSYEDEPRKAAIGSELGVMRERISLIEEILAELGALEAELE